MAEGRQLAELPFWLVFFSAALALNLSPGPDLIYILSSTLAKGRKVGLASTLGACSGAFVHVLAAAVGLSAMLASSAAMFNVVKYLGAAYLVFLGLKSFKAGSGNFVFKRDDEHGTSIYRAYFSGILIDVLNPKVAIFFMAFLPQFIRPGHGKPSLQFLMLGTLVVLVAFIVEGGFVLVAARWANFLKRHPGAAICLDRLFGAILIGIGARWMLGEHWEPQA